MAVSAFVAEKAVRFYFQKAHHTNSIKGICAQCNNDRASLILSKCFKNHTTYRKRVLNITCVLSASSNRNNFRSEKKYSASFAEDARRNASRASRGAQSTRYCCSALIKTGNSLQMLVNYRTLNL